MSRFYSYINTAKVILLAYDGDRPFALFIKDYFKQQKKHGSTDRKQIAHICYCYFRLGKAGRNIETDQRMITALFLCSTHPNQILSTLAAELNDAVQLSLEEKLGKIEFPLHAEDIFPWKKGLSDGMDYTSFAMSHLRQPHLFVRIRPGFEGMVEKKLAAANITFNKINEHCISMDNSSKVNDVIELDKEAVVQDLNSQRVGELVQLVFKEQPQKIWDCCAASGGKSILFHDMFPVAKLTVSDIRKSILNTLAKRFQQAGITGYRSIVADLTKSKIQIPNSPFDLVICDAPCTGSGTWGRTPEQLYFFDEKKIVYYADLQQKISYEASKHLRPGGYLLYITCSVFKKENEDVIKKLEDDAGLKLIEMKLLKGYDQKADTLFAALLQKP
ncbi:MAG: methyltransferase domain-containing protein [Chitinophagaceae bacterium]|nr:methyltransferase domain-containing protein [Chitinophagaceae bacterium]